VNDPGLRRIHERLEERWRQRGYDGLLPEEQAFIVLWWLRAEVENGGFHQYFFNSSGDVAPEALLALESLNAVESARLLRDAIGLLDLSAGYVKDNEARRKHLRGLTEAITRFDGVTDRFYELTEDFVEMALARVGRAYTGQR